MKIKRNHLKTQNNSIQSIKREDPRTPPNETDLNASTMLTQDIFGQHTKRMSETNYNDKTMNQPIITETTCATNARVN